MEIRGGEPGTVFSLFLLFCFIPLYFPFGLNKDCLAAGAEWEETWIILAAMLTA